MPPPPHAPAHTLGDHTPSVAYRLPCVGCNYDLFSLPEDGVCPECGLPIGRSLSGDHLFTSSADYRRLLARGARRAHVGAILGWVALAVGALSAMLHGPGLRLGWLALPALCAAVVPTALGWLALTRDDPEGVAKHNTAVAGERLFVRLWAMIALAGCIGLAAVWLVTLVSRPRADAEAVTATAAAAFVLIGTAMAVSRDLARLLASMSRRLLEGELADRARGLMPAGYVALGLMSVALALTVAPLGGWWWLIRPISWAAAGLALLSWAVIYHTVIRAMAKALQAIAPAP